MKNKKQNYRPLPEYVTILNSEIEGLGLFSTDDIDKGHCIGITHIENPYFPNGYSRTPLGGFYNYSDEPNCESVVDGVYLVLKTLRDIKNGEELTVKYTMYNPTLSV
jgi:SET domain-containing protein